MSDAPLDVARRGYACWTAGDIEGMLDRKSAAGIDVTVVGRDGKARSTKGRVDDVARGVAVPQMSYGVYLFFLALLGALLGAPAAVRRLYRGYGGT